MSENALNPDLKTIAMTGKSNIELAKGKKINRSI